jgi:acetyltransferase-like isoleucine patch superfamily enzyme
MTLTEHKIGLPTHLPKDTKTSHSALSYWFRLKESLLMKILGRLPGILGGTTLRRLLYPTIFSRMGKSVYIEKGVELLGVSNIEIGDSVRISYNANIDAQGQNNRVVLGSSVFISPSVKIVGLDNTTIEIGDRTFINAEAWINGSGHIKIGQDCLIGPRVALIAVNHIFADATRRINVQGHTAKGITIGDDCWLAYGVTVVDGVTIGQGSVIGAGAVVTKDIPPYSIAVGVPAKVIGQRTGLESQELEGTISQAV